MLMHWLMLLWGMGFEVAFCGRSDHHIVMIEYVEYIGFIAGFIFSISGISQALRIIKLKNADAVSITTYIMLLTSMSLWLWYGILYQLWMFVFWNSVAIFIKLIVLGLKIRYNRGSQVVE